MMAGDPAAGAMGAPGAHPPVRGARPAGDLDEGAGCPGATAAARG